MGQETGESLAARDRGAGAADLRVAVIGALRRNNGIGGFIARYLHAHGAKVVAVLGRTEAGAVEASHSLVRYGIDARPFSDFDEMVAATSPQAVVIASPAPTHRRYLERCVDAGVHILCEKPFVDPKEPDAVRFAGNILEEASKKGLTVAMNSQWPFCLAAYEELCGKIRPEGVESFSMRLSPQVGGIDMIPDSMPHALSVLYCGAGPGGLSGVSMEKGATRLVVSFTYSTRSATFPVNVEMVREESQPRTFAFGFNGIVAQRLIRLPHYTISLTHGEKTLKIPDPLERSVQDFLQAMGTGGKPLIGEEHIMQTLCGLVEVYSGY
ncbi:MAG TPA: Gfo/Idh/MocA family oxidoreductase [Deltaproteobacteria bacterium]|nr:Gfo/Idh/MocA family oxidoreductase [Deltaproteobacteria bacterium]HPP81103.1 Gfo/Idh/MocA family oxidoreductase [Deltaproteobacteria bacterium]